VTRTEALDRLHRLAGGLAPDLAGSARLLERVASHDVLLDGGEGR
jgi:hypothetical protein